MHENALAEMDYSGLGNIRFSDNVYFGKNLLKCEFQNVYIFICIYLCICECVCVCVCVLMYT